MTLSLAALRKKPHTSASALKTFLTCPRQYFFRYVECAAAAFVSVSLSFGRSIHHALGLHWTKSTEDQVVPLEELVEAFRRVFLTELTKSAIPVLFDSDEQTANELLDKARQMLSVVVEQFPLPTRVIGVEVPFALALQHPVTQETPELPLVGAMDLLAEFSKTTRVLELKTAARRFGPESEDAIQPTIYKKAAEELGYRNADVEFLVVTKAKTPKLQRLLCERSERDVIELVELALCVERAVRAGIDYRRRDWHCRSCGYAERCSP